eukprot:contig_22133_g5468
MQRQNGIREGKTDILHLEEALQEHKDEASVALRFHKQALSNAAAKYEALVNMFNVVMSTTPQDVEGTDLQQHDMDNLVSLASKDWFEVSSDYQEDKSVPSWNQSPQPGPTYFMSGETHYIHIFCLESCGQAT